MADKPEVPNESVLDNIITEGTPIAPAPEKKGKEEKITITRKEFDTMISTIERQSKDIGTLFEVADKSRLAKIQNATGESLIKTVKISRWPDTKKLILGWKLTKNISEIVNGRWIEEQKTIIIFEDGTNEEITLLDFYRKIEKIKGEVLKRRTEQDSTGAKKEYVTVGLEGGKQVELDLAFIN